VDIGDGLCVVMKIESTTTLGHRAVQGAATGIGGIVRDIFAMGGGQSLCWTPCVSALWTNRGTAICSRVWCGYRGYGNCLGIPTVGGEVVLPGGLL